MNTLAYIERARGFSNVREKWTNKLERLSLKSFLKLVWDNMSGAQMVLFNSQI